MGAIGIQIRILAISLNLLLISQLTASTINDIDPELLQVVGVTGFILTKLDGSARGGCVVGINF